MKSVTIAWRNIRRNRGFSLLNIFGLTVGICCFLLLGAYIVHETSYDSFLSQSNRIAYVSFAHKSADEAQFDFSSVTPTAVAPMLEKEFAEVEKTARIYGYNGEGLVKVGDEFFKEKSFKFADESLFEVMDYTFIRGKAATALASPFQIVLTQKMADKYFPQQDALGKLLRIDGQPWTVSGVVMTPPSYTELPFQAIMSNKHLKRYQQPIWHSANDITLVLLKDPASLPSLQQKANAHIKDIFADVFQSGAELKILFERLPDIHLHSATGTGNLLYVYIFAAVALGIIVIACVNFVNLSLARSAERAKEIGVKKVLGASRQDLFLNFLLECSMMVSMALVLALVLAQLLLPAFANYIGTSIQISLKSSAMFYLGILAFAVLITLIAGSWPAFVISSFKPILSLKGKTRAARGGFALGNTLIIFQFTVSILFIICTLVTTRQLHYIQTTNTGLNRSQIVVLDGDLLGDADRSALKNKLLELSTISGFSASYDSPVNIQGGYSVNAAEGKSANFGLSVTAIPIEKDFVPVFEIPVLAGANLTDADIARARDTTAAQEYSFIVNQQFVQALQWTPAEAIDKRIDLNGRVGRIKTVVADFNFASLKEEIKPVVLFPEYHYFGNVYVKIASGSDIQQSVEAIQRAWKEVKPQAPFDYHFLDDDFFALYQLEQQTNRTMLLFSAITIGIACLGLVALAAFQAQQRVKEIGIRKVLGASVGKIVLLLTRDFVGMVGIAFLIAAPIGWWLMRSWLLNFVYRIDVEWWIFALAASLAVGIAFIVISGQAIRAARTNPVKSLRDE